jgi:hypothetical protein
MGVIAYDRPVRNFISELNATGHVTHTKHRKTKVTLHHNAGRLSLEGILNVWKTRPASAHFQVDGAGNIGQYVLANEYAWATGSTKGNRDSISIEMANSTLGPDWKVSGATTYGAARLAGWLFAKVIGVRPTEDNLVVHSYWSSTSCAGPFIQTVYRTILRQAQQAYDHFLKPSNTQPPVSKPIQKRKDMTTRLVHGDNNDTVPGKGYSWGDLQFLVKFDPELPGGAVRKYMAPGPVQRALQKLQDGVVDIMPQEDLDKIPYAEGGRPPSMVTG